MRDRLVRWLAFALVVLLVSCARKTNQYLDAVVLDYDELGPQAAVYQLIGMQWYQWQPHGSSDPMQIDDIKVVVYHRVSLAHIQQRYPVLKGKQDYRYLDYPTALHYLDTHEHAPFLAHLTRTKKKLVRLLGRHFSFKNAILAGGQKRRCFGPCSPNVDSLFLSVTPSRDSAMIQSLPYFIVWKIV
jgi:hypothetical protein